MTLQHTRFVRRAGLIVIVAIYAACGGAEPPQDGPVAVASEGDLPGDGALPGWSLATEPEHYEAENLWEYINGQADFFIDYGFVRVDAAEYRYDHESIAVVVEVYRMGRPQEAFGIFAAERTRNDRPLQIGARAYLGANVLGFWQGERYVKLTSFDEGATIEQRLIDLAEAISSRLPGPGEELETLALFPEDGRVEASERFIPTNFLGQPYLTDAYRVDYVIDDHEVQLFIVETGSPTEARTHFKHLGDFYLERDPDRAAFETRDDLAMLTVDGASKKVVFQLDRYLGGASATQSLDVGRSAAAALADSLGR